MRITTLIACLASCLAPLCAAAEPFPSPSVDFSAEIEISYPGLPRSVAVQGRIHRSGQRERLDLRSRGGEQIFLLDREADRLQVLEPKSQSYVEQRNALQLAEQLGHDGWRHAEVSLTRVGSQRIDGISTTKYVVTAVSGNGRRSRGYAWLTQEKIPLRMVGSYESGEERSEFRVDYRNLRVEPQGAELFEIPTSYRPARDAPVAGVAQEAAEGAMPLAIRDPEQALEELRTTVAQRMWELQEGTGAPPRATP